MANKERIAYEVDPYNRIVIPRFRTVIDGEFKVNKDNNISYRIKKPDSFQPQELKLSGNWSLDQQHNLILTLDKENNQRQGDKLTLGGEIIDVTANELVFSLVTQDAERKAHFYLLKLGGKWQADKYNRLGFQISKDGGAPNTLTLTGSWEINRNNQILYSYNKSALKTRTKTTHSIIFRGYWEINKKSRLSYFLDKNTGSGFDFKVGIGRPAAKGMEYEIGIGAAGVKKRLQIYGSWKINNKLGLIFEVPVDQDKTRNIILGASCRLNKTSDLELKLRGSRHNDMGIKLKLSQGLLKGLGQAYVEALRQGKEISLIAGMGFRW